MFEKILIANRGEIACRVIKTARRMGIATVAVYSEADANARHVRLADEAVLIGPPAARESYLRADKILDAARATGAQAVHPGYGFLSENEAFAEACAAAGIVFVGPPASAIRAMGSKSAAKALMGQAGVPLTPGYHGDEQDPAFLEAQARDIGFPVLIKASAGGGGKGMRRVDKAEDFAAALTQNRFKKPIRIAARQRGDENGLETFGARGDEQLTNSRPRFDPAIGQHFTEDLARTPVHRLDQQSEVFSLGAAAQKRADVMRHACFAAAKLRRQREAFAVT